MPVRRAGFAAHQALVDKLKLRVCPRTIEVTGLKDLIPSLEQSDACANGLDDPCCIVPQYAYLAIRTPSRCPNLCIYRMDRDGFDPHQNIARARLWPRGSDIVRGVLVLRDVSDTRAVAEHMRQLAESDALTGPPSRLVLDQRLRDALSGLRDGEPLAVLYMDLDGFKAVNDAHGHGAGDELLRQIAHAFATLVGRADTVCRLGGDEFVALLAAPVSTREALALATRFVDAARRPFLWAAHTMSATLSVGVAVAPRDGREPLGLLRAADGALYVAKHSENNRVCVAEPSDQPRLA